MKGGVNLVLIVAIAVLLISFGAAFSLSDWFKGKARLGPETDIAPDIGRGLVGYYEFNKANERLILDSSLSNRTGTLVGDVFYEQGKIGSALNFAGNTNNYVKIPSLHPNSQIYSISMWLKPEQVGKRQLLVSYGGSTAPNTACQQYMSMNSDGQFYYSHGVTSSYVQSNFGTTKAVNRTWVNLVATYDGETLKTYVNGVLAKSLATNITYNIAGDTFFGGTCGYPWYGSIDEVRIYDRILSSDEISILYGDVPVLVDNDGDGYKSDVDCNDNMASIHPGALDICGDVIDNNCDGVLDNGCTTNTTITCTDSDGGLDYGVKGSVKRCVSSSSSDGGSVGGSCGAVADSCSNQGLYEYYCDSANNSLSQLYTCPSGSMCSNGACVNSTTGTRIDGCSLISNSIKLKIIQLQDQGSTVLLEEGDKIFRGNYFVVPGYLMKVSTVTNSTSGSGQYTNDGVKFVDALSDETYMAIITSDGTGTVTIGGKVYGLTYRGASWVSENDRYVMLDYWQTTGNDKMTFNCPVAPYVNETCWDLIYEIANPEYYSDGGVDYNLAWNDTYGGSYWLEGSTYDYKEYVASWNLNYPSRDEGFQYAYLQKGVMVFSDTNFEAIKVLNDMKDGRICTIQNYYQDGNQYKVYACNWNIYDRGISLDSSSYENREILWANENVLIRISIGKGEYLSDEEVSRIIERETGKFLNSLKDNQGKYLGWEDFSIDWPFSSHVFSALNSCPSNIPEDTCSPQWQCITEPAICPEHGFQTQVCKDYNCRGGNIESKILCNPGICSGCLVPKWFESKGLGDNRCIPYGFRFANQIGWNYDGTESSSDRDKISIRDIGNDDDFNLTISPDGVASLYVQEWGETSFIFSRGDTVELNISNYEIIEASMYVNDVVYDSTDYLDSYIDVTFNVTQMEKVAQNIDSYCDIDGNVKQQNSKQYNGEWAECQNNYECDSNLCSSGECVEINDAIKEVKGFRVFIVRIACGLSNPFNGEERAQCVVDGLGIGTSTTESSSGGSGGGSSSG